MKRMNTVISLTIVAAIALLFILPVSSCAKQKQSSDRLGIVVSILPLGSFVRNIAGDKADITIIVPPGASPHVYEPTASQLDAIAQAALIVKAGSGVDFEKTWIDRIAGFNRNLSVIDASNGIELIENDPHIWLSPKNAEIIVHNIRDRLIAIDGKNREYYIRNSKDYTNRLFELDRDIHHMFDGIDMRGFIVYHPAWSYFARDYGLEQISIERAGKEATAKDIKRVVKKATDYNLSIVFVSPQFDSKSAEVVANEIDGITMSLDPLPKNYIQTMRIIAERLATSMKAANSEESRISESSK